MLDMDWHTMSHLITSFLKSTHLSMFTIVYSLNIVHIWTVKPECRKNRGFTALSRRETLLSMSYI